MVVLEEGLEAAMERCRKTMRLEVAKMALRLVRIQEGPTVPRLRVLRFTTQTGFTIIARWPSNSLHCFLRSRYTVPVVKEKPYALVHLALVQSLEVTKTLLHMRQLSTAVATQSPETVTQFAISGCSLHIYQIFLLRRLFDFN